MNMWDVPKRWLGFILNNGNRKQYSPREVVTLKVMNVLGMTLLSSSLSLISYLIITSQFYGYIIPHSLVGIVILSFNRIGKIKLSKVICCLALPIIQILLVIYTEKGAHESIEMTMFPFVMLPIILYAKTNTLRYLLPIFTLTLIGITIGLNYDNQSFGFISNRFFLLVFLFFAGSFIVDVFEGQLFELAEKNKVLKRKNEELEILINQNKVKTELLAIVSHDVKGATHIFDGLTSNIAFLLKKNRMEELMAIGDYFEEASHKLFKRINRLLEWSMSQKENIVAKNENVNVIEIVESLIETLEAQYPKLGLNVKVNIPESIAIETDPNILSIVVKNVLDNAFKYSPHGGNIKVNYTDTEMCHVLEVKDEGTGLDLSTVESVKKGYYHKSRTGHGLGISISMKLVKALNGQMYFSNGPNGGTHVKIELPK